MRYGATEHFAVFDGTMAVRSLVEAARSKHQVGIV
jgi:hypothetical protein